MILNDADWQRTVNTANQLHSNIMQQEKNYLSAGHTLDETWGELEPACAFYRELSNDALLYTLIKKGEYNQDLMQHMGYLLTMLRISLNISQEELAKRLRCGLSEVDFNERNDYPRLTPERAVEILAALTNRLVI